MSELRTNLDVTINTESDEIKVTNCNDKDTIYRQAAISLPVNPKEDRYFQTQNLDDAYELGWFACQKRIETLPSVQPEIIRCKDCKHRYEDECPMRHVEWVEYEDDGYIDMDDVIYDYTEDDGYCFKAER